MREGGVSLPPFSAIIVIFCSTSNPARYVIRDGVRGVSMAEVQYAVDSISVAEGRPHELTLILRQKGENTYLPVWISQHQGQILANELNGRPDDTKDIDAFIGEYNATDSEIIAGAVYLDENAFRARVLLSGHHSPYEVRCPIGRALAVAVRVRAPIPADESLFDRAGVRLSF